MLLIANPRGIYNVYSAILRETLFVGYKDIVTSPIYQCITSNHVSLIIALKYYTITNTENLPVETITSNKNLFFNKHQCQAPIYTLSLCRWHSWRVRLAKQETLTPPGHLVSPLVCRGP